jgi:polar amino acid transport system substrate-binding protein
MKNGLLIRRFRFSLLKLNLIGLNLIGLTVGSQWLLPSPFLYGMYGNLGALQGTAIAAELSEIRDRGYLTIAVKNNQAPLGFIDETGNLSGFEIDIAHRLAEEILGDRSAVRLVPVRNVDRITAVLEDRVDIAIAAITLTEPRRRITSFSDPYYLDGAAFITQNPQIEQLRDLSTGTIALLDRSSTVAHIRYILPGASLVSVSSYAEGRRLLASGTIDAFAGDASVLAGWRLDPTVASARILPSIVSVEPLAIAIPKGQQHDPLRTEINQAVRRWYEEGWLQERAAYWGLPAERSQLEDLGTESR